MEEGSNRKKRSTRKTYPSTPQPAWATVRLPGIRPPPPPVLPPVPVGRRFHGPSPSLLCPLQSPRRSRSRQPFLAAAPPPRLAQSKPPDRPPWLLPARYSPRRPPASARAPRRSSSPSRRPRKASRSPLRAGAEDPVTEVIPVLLAPVYS